MERKGLRLLDLYERLCRGDELDKRAIAEEYGIDERTVRRDLEDLRIYLAQKHLLESENALLRDPDTNRYRLERRSGEFLTCGEVFCLLKILLEGRALPRDEVEAAVRKLVLQAAPSHRPLLRRSLANELLHYREPGHRRALTGLLWQVDGHIRRQEVVQMCYTRQDGRSLERIVRPVALTFADYYFYLVAYLEGEDRDFPAVFRLDRCREVRAAGRTFSIPYRDRFSVGEFRNRVQFMYPGELMRVKFLFWGASLEAVLDRLPTARVTRRNGTVHTVEAEVYGRGIKMWLLTQMEFLEVLEPRSLREEMASTAEKLHRLYNGHKTSRT